MGSGVLSHRLVLATVGGVRLDQTEKEMDGGEFLLQRELDDAAFTLISMQFKKYFLWFTWTLIQNLLNILEQNFRIIICNIPNVILLQIFCLRARNQQPSYETKLNAFKYFRITKAIQSL